jgi:hypothetical protein
MKPLRDTIILLLAYATVTACSRKPETRSVSWGEAENLIREGKIERVVQSHSLDVSIVAKNGSIYHTVEPKIDDVIRIVSEVDPTGKKITIATE